MPCVCNLAGWLHDEYLSSHVARFCVCCTGIEQTSPLLSTVVAAVYGTRSVEWHLFRWTTGFGFFWLEKANSYYYCLCLLFGRVCTIAKRDYLLCHTYPSVSPHETARLSLRICMKVYIWGFFENLWRKLGLINPLNPELNPICYLLALLAHHFLHVSRIRVKSLPLRFLMSYVYICMEHLFLMFLDHIRRRSTVDRTPLDEWSARRRDLYLTTHDTHNRQISMPPVGFEPTISEGERPVAARLLRSIFVCCECRVLSGRGLCDELITRPEESYRLCCVVVCDLETSRMGAPYIYIWH